MKKIILIVFCIVALSNLMLAGTTTVYYQKAYTGPHTPVYIPFSSASPLRSVHCTITVNPVGGPPANVVGAANFAAGIWQQVLSSQVTITVNILYAALPAGVLAETSINNWYDGSAISGAGGTGYAPIAGVLYPQSLADRLQGPPGMGGVGADMEITLQSGALAGGATWFTGSIGPMGNNQIDMVSVIMHEMGHGFGFDGAVAFDGTNIINDPSLPSNEPSTYDNLVQDATPNPLNGFFPITPPDAGLNSFCIAPMFFTGGNAEAANGGAVPLYSPNPFSNGSSLYHLDQTTYQYPDANCLMTPFRDVGESIHDPGPVSSGILNDIGWEQTFVTGIADDYAAITGAGSYTAPTTLLLGQPIYAYSYDYSGSTGYPMSQTWTVNLIASDGSIVNLYTNPSTELYGQTLSSTLPTGHTWQRHADGSIRAQVLLTVAFSDGPITTDNMEIGIPSPPDIPALTAQMLCPDSVELGFYAPGATSYVVYYGPASGYYTSTYPLAPGQNSFTTPALGIGHTVYFSVVGTNSSGTGSFAPESQVLVGQGCCVQITGNTHTDPRCNGDSSGSVNLTLLGTATPFTYAWSNGATTQNLSGLAPGIYTVTVTDTNGCTATASDTITQPAPVTISYTKDSVICYGDTTAEIDLTVTGGTPYGFVTYYIPWSANVTETNYSGTQAYDLGAGTYIVTAIDENGCASPTDTIIISQPPPISVTGVVGNVPCGDTTGGYIITTVTGGAYPPTGYVYQWSTGAIGSNLLGPLAAGTYTLTVHPVGCADADTVSFVVHNDTCCTPPAITLSFPDTICVGSLDTIFVSGAPWGRVIIDGDPLFILSEGNGGIIGPVPATAAGTTHTLCYVGYSAYPDSGTLFCSDTICTTFTIINCCTKPTPVLTVNGDSSGVDTVCLNSRVIFYANGAPWGKFYLDSAKSSSKFKPIPPSGFVDTEVVSNISVGTHTICFIAYTDTTPNACTDTVCITVVIENCGCENISGTSHLIANSLGNMQYQFYDSFTSIAPNFINWIVDDSIVGRTIGTDTFIYQFSPGHHIICMQTGTFLPDTNGDNICCYNTICDSIYIDACAYWRATGSITFEMDSTNVDSVTFTFHGSTSPLWPTLVWNFGDGTTLVSSNLTVGHLFSHSGGGATGDIYNVCVNVIWSRLDSITYDSLDVCCCVDTICLTVSTDPCLLPTFYAAIVDSSGGTYVFEILHTTSFTTIGITNWSVNSMLEPSGPFLTYTPMTSGLYEVCANYSYTVLYNGVEQMCNGKLCQNFNLTAPSGAPGGFVIYPNPTTGQTVVQITNNTDSKTAQVDIDDVTGKRVMSKTFFGLGKGITQNYLDISTLPQGIYTIRMTLGNVLQIDKLVKE